MPGLGHLSYIQLCKESGNWGSGTLPTAANRGQRLELLSWNVKPNVSLIDDNALYARQSRRAKYPGARVVKGSFTVRLNYEGLEEIFRAAFGSKARAVVSGKLADYTFTEASAVPALTIEAFLGGVSATTKSFNVTGAKVTSLAIRGTAGTGNDAMLTCEVGIIAKDMTSENTGTPQSGANVVALTGATISGGTTVTVASTGALFVGMVVTGANILVDGTVIHSITSATVFELSAAATNGSGQSLTCTAPQLPGVYPVLYHHASTVDDGTADATGSVRVRSFEVTLENALTEDRFYLSSVNPDEPLRGDFLSARWRFTQEFTTVTQFDAYRATTSGSPKLIFTHPTAIEGSARAFELRSNNAVLVEYDNPVEAYGVLISTATWDALYDTTDASALVARIRNVRPDLA